MFGRKFLSNAWTTLKAHCYARLCPKSCGTSSAPSSRPAPDPHVPTSPYKFIAIGIVLICICLFLEHSPAIRPHIYPIIFELGKHIGVAFVVLGSISFGLEVPHWTEYFKDRLAQVVLEYRYLDKLQDKQIEALQLETWKRLFRGADIKREGSFLGYFESRIKNLIGAPYRETAVEHMIVTDSSDPDCYDYTTIVTYKCHRVQDKLQKDVSWAPEHGEFKTIRRVKMELILPPGSAAPKNPQLNSVSDKFAFHEDTLTYEFSWEPDPAKYFKCSVSLDDFHTYDGMIVRITGEGTIPKDGFIGWGMSHPTKDFVLICQPPPGKYARHELFGIDEKDVRRADDPDKKPECQERLTLICNTWVMPYAGVAICFLPR